MTRSTWFILAPIVALIVIGLAYRALLQYYGLTITSQWRSPATNEFNKGKQLSLHLIGLAWDIRLWDQQEGELNRKLQAFLRWLPWGKVVPESDHVHIQFL